jgi:hypothetical protein
MANHAFIKLAQSTFLRMSTVVKHCQPLLCFCRFRTLFYHSKGDNIFHQRSLDQSDSTNSHESIIQSNVSAFGVL